jgi:uncharacterized OB-fold protein/acyl dehydratase
MTEAIRAVKDDAFVVEGKLALPYQYFAGKTGSKFLIALRDAKKLLGVRCPKCNKVYVPPRLQCELHPGEKCSEWVELPGTGEVTSYTVIRYAEPYQPLRPPYVLALIKLDGADSGLVHVVKDIAPKEMRVGLKVKAVFAKKSTTGTNTSAGTNTTAGTNASAGTNTIMEIDHFEPDEKPGYELGYSYEELEVGMSATFTKTISETDVYLFAGISGDFNPMHVNQEFAKKTPFGTRIAHGALPQSLIAPVLGMKLPGLGTVALEVTARFRAPTYFGDTITARAMVAEKLEEKKWVRMDCLWTNQDGKVVATGSALVMPPRKP